MLPLLEELASGDRRKIARLITRVENDEKAAREIVSAIYGSTGKAQIVGITGPPGSGKSTLVNELAKSVRRLEKSVGIIAVDPSSPFSGGALLGDRVRMRDLSGDEGIFIRSMASRGSLGGLARATHHVIKVLDAAGFEVILVETVGAGQAEVDIASAAHTTVVIEAPGMGDDIQTIKAGILEVADVLVVNKADRPGADRAVGALRTMLHMGKSSARMSHHGRTMLVDESDGSEHNALKNWQVSVYKTVAIDGTGVEELLSVILDHRRFLKESGGWLAKELVRSRQEIGQLLQAEFLSRLKTVISEEEREKVIAQVAAREIDPYEAVHRLIDRITL